MPINFSPKTLKKLQEKHGVSEKEVHECFANRAGRVLLDTREDHKTDPATVWFIAQTNKGRCLKVVFIKDGRDIWIKTCYGPNQDELDIYRRLG